MALNKLTTNHIADNTIKSAKIADGAITDAKISESTTISLSKTTATGTQPTISGLSITQKSPGSAANVTITGTNFVSIPSVQFVNQSTGARITASTVTYTSSTSLTVSFPAGQSVASYKVYVENPGGLAVQSTATIINSDAPNWSTDASLGSYEEGESVNVQLLAYDDDSTAVTGYTLQSGSLPSGITLSGDSTIGSLSGTAPTVSADTAYNFTIRATDNESQTTDKAFNMTIADYNIGNTLLLNEGDSPYLNRTQSSGTSDKIGTFSVWVKGSLGGGSKAIFSGHTDSSNRIALYFSDSLRIYGAIGGSQSVYLISNALFRDPSAWYHFTVAWDTTQATDTNRFKCYVNGSQITSFSTAAYPTQNADVYWNKGTNSVVGARYVSSVSSHFNGYAGETIFVDGQQLAATSFGESNSDGVWIPKKYTGSYGTNGFLLEYDSSGSLGTDTSGNGNNFTANNLAATDQMEDSPHLNYTTWNPLVGAKSGGSTLYYPTTSQGNLRISDGNAAHNLIGASTFGFTQGKWYAEFKLESTGDTGSSTGFGTIAGLDNHQNAQYDAGYTNAYTSTGVVFTGASSANSGTSFTTTDTVGVAVDADNGYIYFHKNGTYINSGDPTSGGSGTGGYALVNLNGEEYFFHCMDSRDGNNVTLQANFGSPFYSISSGNSDGNGYGNFEYSVPTGYYALNSKNLATYG